MVVEVINILQLSKVFVKVNIDATQLPCRRFINHRMHPGLSEGTFIAALENFLLRFDSATLHCACLEDVQALFHGVNLNQSSLALWPDQDHDQG